MMEQIDTKLKSSIQSYQYYERHFISQYSLRATILNSNNSKLLIDIATVLFPFTLHQALKEVRRNLMKNVIFFS